MSRKVKFREETVGVYSGSLFDARCARSMTDQLKSSAKWRRAEVREELSVDKRISVERSVIRSASVAFIDQRSTLMRPFNNKLSRVIIPLIERVWQIRLKEHDGLQAVWYRTGGHYRAHTDAGLDLDNRYFTIICYLNEEYEGGHTWFPSLNYSSTPMSGKAIVFPSTYVHQAQPVTAGEKYVLVSWILGPKPARWIR